MLSFNQIDRKDRKAVNRMIENETGKTDKQEIIQEMENLLAEMGFSQKEKENFLDGVRNVIDEVDIPDIDIHSDEGLQNAIERINNKSKDIAYADKQNLAAEYLSLLRTLGQERIIQIKQTKNEWIPRSIDEFKKIMPSIEKQYPKIYYATSFNVERVLDEISNEMHAKIEMYSETASCEYFHGEDGNAVVVYLDHIKSADYTAFALEVWNCLGRFYAINYEPKEWFDNYEWDVYDSSAKCCGYQLWSFFIGFAIANVVYIAHNKPYELNKFTAWLTWILGQAFSDVLSEYREKDLSYVANYFASLLTFNYDVDDCISTVPSVAQPFLRELQVILAEQMQKEQYYYGRRNVGKNRRFIAQNVRRMGYFNNLGKKSHCKQG